MRFKTMAVAVLCGAMLLTAGTTICTAKDFSVGLKATTLGVAAEGEYAFSPHFGARLGLNYFTYDYDDEIDDIDYDFDLELMSVSALFDWHPFQGSFRVSAGVMYNGNELDAKANPAADQTYDIGDVTYSAADVGTLDGSIEWEDLAPYVGLGWDTSFGEDNAFGFLFEVGAMFQGSPDVTLTANGPIADDATFQEELRKERKELEDDLDSFNVYPVVSIGFCYRF